MERAGMSKKTENIIVILIMIAIVAGLLLTVGYENIKDWLGTPFVWKSHEDINVLLFYKTEETEDELSVRILIENRTHKEIKVFEFLTYVEGVQIPIHSQYLYNTIEPYGQKMEIVTLTKAEYAGFADVKVDSQTYDKIKNTPQEDLRFEYRTVYLEDEDQVLVNNNGTKKIITILVAAVVLGLLGMIKKFPVWLRIILKVCSLPLAILLIIMLLFVWGRSVSGNTQSANNSQYDSAKKRYDRAATLKAGAIRSGNRHSAAKAQAEMDHAMADMIVARGGDRSAANNYKREASLKAGAVITGRGGDAARSQANMDKDLTKMLEKK